MQSTDTGRSAVTWKSVEMWKQMCVASLLLLFFGGCASISQDVPKLSNEVGERLVEMRSLHLRSVHRMFDHDHRAIDTFLDDHWIPSFLKNYLGISGIVATVSENRTISSRQELSIVSAMRDYLADPAEAEEVAAAVVKTVETTRAPESAAVRRELDRFVEAGRLDEATAHVMALLGSDFVGQEILAWAREADRQIQQQRKALHDPLDKAEEELLAELNAAYDELIAAQTAITARVQAAADVKELQDKALERIGAAEAFAAARAKAAAVSESVDDMLEKMKELEGKGLLHTADPAETLRDAILIETAPADSTR